MKDGTVIVISRQYGSGGRELAQILSQKLGLHLYDRQLIHIAAAKIGIDDMKEGDLKQLEEEGVLTLNKELRMPRLPQRIAVVSSPTAAGYGDFCHQLQNNPGGFYFYTELFPALMQGDRVEESVLSALDKINSR